MTTIFNVASYILDIAGTITTMKRQKLAYYSQAYLLDIHYLTRIFRHGEMVLFAQNYLHCIAVSF